MPPGLQMPSSRAAMLTPSPRMSSPSTDVAEMDADAVDDALAPAAPALRSAIIFCISIAHSTAATTDGNSSRRRRRSS